MVILRCPRPHNKVFRRQNMVRSGHDAIQPVDFESRRHPRLPVEVLDMDELRARADPDRIAAPRRPSFHLLLLMRSPRGSQIVDFREIPARPGRLLSVRPGQVHVFDLRDGADATLLLSRPDSTSARPWFPGHRSYGDLDETALASAEHLIDVLRRQQERFAGDEPSRRLMIALFDAVLALFDQAQAVAEEESGSGHLPALYLDYRRAIEDHLAEHHHVVDYARLLGYSARSLTRACQEATGQTAKRILADRLVLEAKRLLAHTDASAADVSARLGFSEPTNFGTSFTRSTGQTPPAFRRLQRGDAAR